MTVSKVSTTTFEPVSLDEMIQHDDALAQDPWLSAQILNRWRKQSIIRCFRGKEGRAVYPKSDLSRALLKEMTCDENSDHEDYSNTAGSGSTRSQDAKATTATGTMSEADALREKLSMQSIFGTPKKNSSSSSVARRPQAKTHLKSV